MASFFTEFPQLINPTLELVLSLKETQALVEAQKITEVDPEALETLYT